MYTLKLTYYEKWDIKPFKHLALLTLYRDHVPVVCSYHECSTAYLDSIVKWGRTLEDQGVKFIIKFNKKRWSNFTKWEYIRRAKSMRITLHRSSLHTKSSILEAMRVEQMDLFQTPSGARV